MAMTKDARNAMVFGAGFIVGVAIGRWALERARSVLG